MKAKFKIRIELDVDVDEFTPTRSVLEVDRLWDGKHNVPLLEMIAMQFGYITEILAGHWVCPRGDPVEAFAEACHILEK